MRGEALRSHLRFGEIRCLSAMNGPKVWTFGAPVYFGDLLIITKESRHPRREIESGTAGAIYEKLGESHSFTIII
jgi:hypothetical protein